MEYIDLDNSYVFFSSKSQNTWRSSVKSLLFDLTENKNLYLTKECRSEIIGKYPFAHDTNAEFNAILEDNSYKYVVRNTPVFRNDNDEQSYCKRKLNSRGESDECVIKKTNYQLLEFNDIIDRLKNKLLENIYCKIDYQFENKKYSLFSKVEYINFSGNYNYKNENYLQPIMGYIPFKKNSKVYIAYVALYVGSEENGNLEFKIRENTEIKVFYKKNFGRIGQLKHYLLNFLNFLKISEFSKTISINDSKCNFYKKTIS